MCVCFSIRPVLEVSDNEDESGDLLDLEGAPQGADETLRKSRNNSIKASSRRKRSQEINDMEVDETVGSRKRRKSARPMADTPPHHHRDFFYRRNEYDHWYGSGRGNQGTRDPVTSSSFPIDTS